MSTVIDELRRRRRKRNFEKWLFRAVLAEAFLVALSPAAATAALVFGTALLFMRFYMLPEIEFVKLPFDVPAVLFLVLSLISVLMSPDMSFSFYNWYNLAGVYGLTYLLVGQSVFREEHVKKVAAALALGALLSLLYGFMQYLFGVSSMTQEMRWVDGEAFPEITERIYSTWENPNIFAGYLDMAILVTLGFFTTAHRSRIKKIVLAAFMLAMVFGLALTYSRGAILSLAAVFAVYGVIRERRLLFAMIAVGVALLVFDTALYERIASVGAGDSSSALRFALWESTIAMIQDHPFFGIGWGAYFMVYPEYDFFIQNPDVIIYHAHNMYLNYAAEIGMAGAAAFFWFFFGTMKTALVHGMKAVEQNKPTSLLGSFEKFDNLPSIADKLARYGNFRKKDKKEEPPATDYPAETFENDITAKLTPLLIETATSVAEKSKTETATTALNKLVAANTDDAADESETATTVTETPTSVAKKIVSESATSVQLAEPTDKKTVVAEKAKEAPIEKVLKKDDENTAKVNSDKIKDAAKVAEPTPTPTPDAEPSAALDLTDENSPREMTLSEAVEIAKAITREHEAKIAKERRAEEAKKTATDAAEKIIPFAVEKPADEPLPVKYDEPEEEEENWRDALSWNYEQVADGLTLGIGLAFVSVALNGLTDDVLFNIPSSMLLWFLAALVAVINADDAEKDTPNDAA